MYRNGEILNSSFLTGAVCFGIGSLIWLDLAVLINLFSVIKITVKIHVKNVKKKVHKLSLLDMCDQVDIEGMALNGQVFAILGYS